MKNVFKYYVVYWAVLASVFNLIVFIAPNEMVGMNKFGGAFWSGYVFIMLAFVGQLVCAYLAFKAENKQKFFYNLPLITISYAATIASVIVGTLCMVIPNLPNWVGIIICLVILAFSAVSVVKAKAAADVVSEIDKKIKVKTLFIKSLTVDAESLMARAKTDEINAELKKVYEAVRYSDPMSEEALSGIESQITLKFDLLSKAVVEGNAEAVKSAAEELVILINDRNKKCKLLK